jgi:serine/threonine protein kinase
LSLIEEPIRDSCYSKAEIRAMLLGHLAPQDVQRHEHHLSVCPRCASLAESIGLDSGIASCFLGEDLPPPVSENDLEDVLARVCRIEQASRKPATKTWSHLDLPEQLGPYHLKEFLGSGGMGVVYRAEDTVLNRLVAIKVIKTGADAETRAQLLNEARALAAVRHENVVTVYFVGEQPADDDGVATPYFAMELLEGQTLRDYMTSSRPSVEWIIQVGRQIAAGLAVVHDAGIVHRDIKPGNIWLEKLKGETSPPASPRSSHDAIPQVKLLDFGLAHQVSGLSGIRRAGTPAYVAPEQIHGADVDGRADIFSLGCVLYELCTGQLPYPELKRLGARWDLTPPPIRTLNSDVPTQLATLIEKMVIVDPAARPASARMIQFELTNLATASNEPPTVTGQSDLTVEFPASAPQKTRLPVLSASLLLAAIAIAAISLLNSNSATDFHSDDHPASPQQTAPSMTVPAIQLPPATLSSDVLDDAWREKVLSKPPQLQLNEVLQRLALLNPKFDWLQGSGWVEPYGVIRITLDADTISDLRPVQVLDNLRVVRCRGSAPGTGTLSDVTPLSTLPLEELHCRNNPHLRDLSSVPLKHLNFLDASFTALETLEGFSEARLAQLKITGTKVSDLSPLRTMKTLRRLNCVGCPISDFTPLIGLPLRQLHADVQADRDQAVLRSIKTLETINQIPIAEFWKKLAETGSSSPSTELDD